MFTIYPPLKPKGSLPMNRLSHEFAKGAEKKKAEAKRLNDAELSAEYMRSEADFYAITAGFEPREDFMWPASPGVFRKRIDTLLRFATSDHALEDS